MVRKKRILFLIAGALIISSLAACNSSGKSKDVKEVGVIQLVQHGALDKANEGFTDGLKEKGYKDGENINIDFKNAQGKTDVANQISGQFVTDKKDLIFSIATPAAQAAYNATKDIPIVFTAVTDPVDAGIAKDWDNSGTNVTGTSDKVSIDEQLKLLKDILPNVKNLGFIYTTSEANSLAQLKEIKDLAPKYDLTIKEIGVANSNEINQNLTNAMDSIDALYAPTDNEVAKSYALVGDICINNNKPIIGAESAVLEYGGLVSKGIDYYELGKQAGYKAAEILDGKKPSDISIDTMKDFVITINTDVAKKLNITIPEEIDKNATKVTGGVN